MNNHVYIILGDGECNEGSVWEAAMSAPKFKLDNLNVILDKNNFQQTGSNNEIMSLGNVADKWKSFGWDVDTIDGHNILELKKYFDKENKNSKPKILIANTIKGKGFSFSENNNDKARFRSFFSCWLIILIHLDFLFPREFSRSESF